MASILRVVVPLVFLFFISVVAAGTDTDRVCETALNNLISCMYIGEPGARNPDTCCNGLRKINGLGSTPSDRQAVCGCIKIFLVNLSPGVDKLLASYSGRRGVNLFFKLDPSIDCNSLN